MMYRDENGKWRRDEGGIVSGDEVDAMPPLTAEQWMAEDARLAAVPESMRSWKDFHQQPRPDYQDPVTGKYWMFNGAKSVDQNDSVQDMLTGKNPKLAEMVAKLGPQHFNVVDGYTMVSPEAREKISEALGIGDDGFWGKDGPFQAFSKTVGLAAGLSAAFGGGLNYLANGGGPWAEWAAGMLPEGGYQSLFSSLSNMNVPGSDMGQWMYDASGGINGTGGIPSGSVAGYFSEIPDYVSEPFEDFGSGSFTPSNGGFFNSETGLMDFSTPAGGIAATTPGLSLNSLGNASGMAVNAGIPVGKSMSFLDDLFSAKNLVSLAGNLGSSLIQSRAIDKATGAQIDSAGQSNALLRDMYLQNRADLEPWRQTGVNALGRLNALTKPGSQVSEMEMDPGYQFRLSQGVKARDRSAASRGLLQSGAQVKGIEEYGQDYATGEYGNIINRQLAMAGMGQAATNTGVQAGQNYGNQASQNLTGAGNARASGYVGNANSLSAGIGGFLNNQSQNALLDRLIGGR